MLAEEMHVSGILTLIVAIIATKAWIDMDIKAHVADENTVNKSKTFMRKLRLEGIKATTTERLEYIYEMAKEFGYIAAVMIFFVLAEIVSFEKLWQY